VFWRGVRAVGQGRRTQVHRPALNGSVSGLAVN